MPIEILIPEIVGLALKMRGAEIDSRGNPIKDNAKYRLSRVGKAGKFIIDKIENINPN